MIPALLPVKPQRDKKIMTFDQYVGYIFVRMMPASFLGTLSVILFTDPTPRNILVVIPAGLASLYLVFLCLRECVRFCLRELPRPEESDPAEEPDHHCLDPDCPGYIPGGGKDDSGKLRSPYEFYCYGECWPL